MATNKSWFADKRDLTAERTIEHEIFSYVPKRIKISKGYSNSIQVFTKELAKQMLFKYLFLGRGGSTIDEDLTEGARKKGWLTSGTLAFLQIETNGWAKKSLRKLSESDAIKLIDDFVNEYY